MAKNIILCSDGTGNKGGYTPDSNVYKMYKAIEIHDKTVSQYTFYDNGIGTSTNKYWRALTGATGAGIKQNILDLYCFLSLNYQPGDQVFLFGFSRGAATIRAFCGMIKAVGLVNTQGLTGEQIKNYAKDAYEAYKNHRKDSASATGFSTHRYSHGVIKIHFVGVWDTVSALGFPKLIEKKSITLCILTAFFKGLECISNWLRPHFFYDYDLSNNVLHAYQALAIDDERTAFWPRVWNEVSPARPDETTVEQVWFSGMHSNVGGGYERQGMANVSMHWMMLRAAKYGLVFKPGAIEQVYEDSNIHGRLYNSRDGMAIYYRYHPREIEKLCQGKLQGEINIHDSTLERLKKRTGNYAPVVLPAKFAVVKTDLDATGKGIVDKTIDVRNDEEIKQQQEVIKLCINRRKWLYALFVDFTVAVILYVLYFSCTNSPDEVSLFRLIMNSIKDSDYFGLIKHLYEYHLHALIVVFLVAFVMYDKRESVKDKMTWAAEEIRKTIVSAW